MKKEEFLAMSLNCGLKVILNRKGKFNLDEEYPEPHNEICEVVDVLKSNSSFDYEISDGNVSYGFIELDEFDFICRPLTDLTKPIEHNGEKFIPINKLKTYFGWAYLWGCYKKRETINVYAIPYACLNKLIEWHFDIAGLIEKGEAINVNTLPKNPYK